VICGEGQTCVALIAWPNRAVLEKECGIAPGAALTGEALANQTGGGEALARLHGAIRERLVAHNAANPGASTRVRRVLLLQEPPSPGAHELSDKGTVNRSAVLQRRAADVERLYATPPGPDVIVVD
jgi:feruloyl-CoA synthase